MSKRSRAEAQALSTRPFSRLAVQLIRHLSTFLKTADWMRLVPSLSSEDMTKVLQFVTQPYYDSSAAALIRNVATFQKMVTFSMSRMTKLSLIDVGVLPDPTTWQDMMQHATGLVEIVWRETQVDHGNAVQRHLRALSHAMRRLTSIQIRFPKTTGALDAALQSGLLVERQLEAKQRPLTTLEFTCGTPLLPVTAQKIMAVFPALADVTLSVEWNAQMLSQHIPLWVTSLSLLAKEPRDWPDIKTIQPFFQQRPESWKALALRQGHLQVEIERSKEDGLPQFDLLHLPAFDVDNDSPSTLLPPDMLLEYWTTLFPRWHSIDLRTPRQSMRALAALAEWTWFGEQLSVGDVTFRRDIVLEAEEWDDAKAPWLDDEKAKSVARALRIGAMKSVWLTNAYSANVMPAIYRQLSVTQNSMHVRNLRVHTVLPWLNHLGPLKILNLILSHMDWSSDDLARFLQVLMTRKDPLTQLQVLLEHDPEFARAVRFAPQVFPTAQLAGWPLDTLKTLRIEYHPLDDSASLCRGTLSKMTSLRSVSLCSRRPIGRDELLLFSPELVELSWVVRTSEESKEPLNEQLMMEIARRYRNLKFLELDIRPTQLRAQPPESTFWRDWIRLLPKLKQLSLALHSFGFTWNERLALQSVDNVNVRLLQYVGAPPGSKRGEVYHRFAAPVDPGDNGSLHWSDSDDMAHIPMQDNLRRWPQRLVYALPEDWSWPEMWIADGDVKRTGDVFAIFRDYVTLLFGDSTRWTYQDQLHLLFDHEAKTVEHLRNTKVLWSELTATIEGKQGWKAQASWPNTWYRSAEDEGQGHIGFVDFKSINSYAFNALYMTMRVLNPNVPAQRIGQGLYLPSGRPAIYDRFEAFFYATNRRLARATPAAPSVPASALASTAMTDQRMSTHVDAAATVGTMVLRRGSEGARPILTIESASLPPPSEMQLLARDAARIALGVDQIRFRRVDERE